MRVALVNPPNTRQTGHAAENAAPPLGICYIAATLRAAGIETDLFDFAEHVEPSEQFLRSTGFFTYDVYGFTAYTKTFAAAIGLVQALRAARPEATVVFGGPHASPCAADVLSEYPQIDYVIRNEGEQPMLALVRLVAAGGGDLGAIPSLTYRSPDGIAATPASPDLVEMDTLPHPARDFVVEPSRLSLEHRRRSEPAEVVYLSSSRGCPKKCTFCSIVVMSPRYRFRSVESLMDEIRALYAQRPFGHINFHDANFFCYVPRTLAFARALHAWNPAVTWSGTATADMVVRHGHILAELGRTNCAFLEIGIESGNQAALARFNKRTSVDQNREAIQLLQRAGVDLGLDFIMYDPETTLEDLIENFAFLFQSDLLGYAPPECLYNAMSIYPGTPARDRYVEMFGLAEHHLMPLIPPFCDARAADVYRRMMRYFREFAHAQTHAIDELEAHRRALLARYRGDDAAGRAAQAIVALMLRLRHEPYRYFAHVLDDAGQAVRDETEWPSGVDRPFVERMRDALEAATRIAARRRAGTRRKAAGALNEPNERAGRYASADELLVVEEQLTVYLIPRFAAPHRLNLAASAIWRRIAAGSEPEDVVPWYAAYYGCDDETARADVESFLRQMLDGGFLVDTRLLRRGA